MTRRICPRCGSNTIANPIWYQGHVEGQDYHKIQVRTGDGAGAGCKITVPGRDNRQTVKSRMAAVLFMQRVQLSRNS